MGDRHKEAERKALSVAGVETTALVATAPEACRVEKEKPRHRTFRRDRECKQRVFKQKVSCEQRKKANSYGDLRPGRWLALAMVAEHTPGHHGSDREGQAVMGFTRRNHLGLTKATPKDRQIKANGPGKKWTTREKQQY